MRDKSFVRLTRALFKIDEVYAQKKISCLDYENTIYRLINFRRDTLAEV